MQKIFNNKKYHKPKHLIHMQYKNKLNFVICDKDVHCKKLHSCLKDIIEIGIKVP